MNLQRTVDKNLKGWLKRKGGRMNTWARRWFVLTDKFLFIYGKEDEVKSQDCITLDEHVIVEPPVDLNDPKKIYFDIITNSDKAPSETVLSLCADSEEEKKIWIRGLKRALYADKGGALFSQSLEEILYWEKKAGRRIPYIIDECVEYLYKYALDTEGIFRLPGRQSAIKDIIARFEQGQKVVFEKEGADVHAVASVLKAFLRDLPDSIIPCNLFQKFMNFALRYQGAQTDQEKEIVVGELSNAMALIPEDNYVILKYVCRFLRDVGLQEELNKMTMWNLATIFGYNIIRHIDKENSELFLCTADLGQNLVYMLLQYFTQVFTRAVIDSISNVPTADLLSMSSSSTKTPSYQPLSHVAELEGLQLNVDQIGGTDSLPLNENHFKNTVRLRNFPSFPGDDNNDEDGVFLSATDLRSGQAIRPKGLGALTLPPRSTLSLPNSPTPLEDPPVAPQRSKTKIVRNRGLSDRRRPGGMIVLSGDASTRGSSRDEASPLGVNSEDVITALDQMKKNNHINGENKDSKPASMTCANTNNEKTTINKVSQATTGSEDSCSVSSTSSVETMGSVIKPIPSKRRHRNFGSTQSNPVSENQPPPSVAHSVSSDGSESNQIHILQEEIDRLTNELSNEKQRHRSQISTLQSQLTAIGEKYESRIKAIEGQSKAQQDSLEAKLASEQRACATAVAHTISLKDELHRYQMRYGELPT